jgi:hypothetical protein
MAARLSLASLAALAALSMFQPMFRPWGLGHAEEPTAFLSALEDVPLMPALTELREAAVRLDTAEGRIVVAWATGAVDQAGVAGFYAETLPQLGWVATGSERYLREGEVLKLDMFAGDVLTLRYTLSPE